MNGGTLSITVTDRATGKQVTTKIRREGPDKHFTVVNDSTGRPLSTVEHRDGQWEAYSTPEAFRGSAATEGTVDAGPTHIEVPDWLWGGDRPRAVIARAATDHAAIWHLLAWLIEHRAPAVGYGPHPDVKPRRMYDRFEVTDYDGSAPLAVIHCITDDPQGDMKLIVTHAELPDMCESIGRYQQARGLHNTADGR